MPDQKLESPFLGLKTAILPPFSLQLLQSLCCKILWHFYSAQVVYHCPEMHHSPSPPTVATHFLPHFLHLFHLFSSSFRPGRERPISVHPVEGVTVEVEGSSIHQVQTFKDHQCHHHCHCRHHHHRHHHHGNLKTSHVETEVNTID